jgi:cyclophilin family peptidyl-prolyl cis-trans isomerase
MASNDLTKGWDSVEKKIKKSQFDEALLDLRGLDESGDHAMTWKLAGDCKKGLSEELGQKKAYREAAKHYKQALKMDPKFKDARVGLEGLQNEMLVEGVREKTIPKMIDDGTPTLFGIVAIPLLVLILLAGVKVISDSTLSQDSPAYDYTAVLNVQWVDSDGLFRNDAITIELYVDAAPIHVENWLGHARAGNYDGIRWHRIIDGFMLQTGDIEGKDGSGGYAYEFQGYCNGQVSSSCDKSVWTIPDESNNGIPHKPGSLAMAKTSAANTGGSQFYIVDKDGSQVPPSHLDGVHTVFGQVIDGMDIIDGMGQVQTGSNDMPLNEMIIKNIEISSEEKKGFLDYLMFW